MFLRGIASHTVPQCTCSNTHVCYLFTLFLQSSAHRKASIMALQPRESHVTVNNPAYDNSLGADVDGGYVDVGFNL